MRALREAGYRAGVTIARAVAEDPGSLRVGAFWKAVSASFEEAGLGSVRYEGVSPSIGAVSWTDSPEASGNQTDRPGARCHFAAGVLAGLLGQAAGKTVDVLEIRCGAGDRACWFLFGTVASMRAVQRAARDESARRVDAAATGVQL